MTGGSNVGGLIGYIQGGTVSNSYEAGSATGNSYVGGLVGYLSGGTVLDSFAMGAVKGLSAVGGLVGEDYLGTISNSYSTGGVTVGSGGPLAGGSWVIFQAALSPIRMPPER